MENLRTGNHFGGLFGLPEDSSVNEGECPAKMRTVRNNALFETIVFCPYVGVGHEEGAYNSKLKGG